ncbi:MAG: siderophore ABC transporter substrate-binding protein [Nocardioides marinisabuli]|uniref:siderophore ABC transporter substrate-binding protein n=1 Tax=Nocardioides marinisabuli TaxID=419476 RepID=UPI0032191AB8
MHLRRPRPTSVALATLALPAALALTACGGSDETATDAGGGATVTIETARGPVEVPQDPERVLTFDIGVLDTIDTLGGEVAGVPEFALPEYLSAYDDAPIIGSLFEPDFEAVAEIDPDLIIVTGRSLEAMPDLEELAPTIDLSVDESDYLGSVERNVRSLAAVLGEEDAAEQALADLEAEVEETRAAGAEAGTGLIVMTSAGEVSAYGAGSRFGLVHDVLGVEPAVDIDSATHGEPVSFEFVAEADPDWLFVVDRDVAIGETSGESAEQVLDNALVARTTAWSQDQVVQLDPLAWYIVSGGLTATRTMVSDVADGIAS